ncbi:MAG: LCP family protein [Candidatus Doudnabacteria bacterium]|nr:LCP family protein [Candidatus Doudnabacteria bacterium]
MPNLDGIQNNNNHFVSHEFAPRPSRRGRKWKWLILILILLAGIGFAGYKFLWQANKIFTGNKNIFQRIGNLIITPDKQLIGEEDGEVNILLLGVGGPGHEGPLLTDTMIVANINTKTNEVVLISVPRDFLVELPNRGLQKINATYAYAEKDDEGSGGDAILAKMQDLTGLKIPYYAVVDFKGFVKAVDDVGGLDITIDRTFTDSTYPDYNNGYLAPVTFTKGNEHMNGERALIFARSRKGNNNEGSDFARSERQKKIILALKEKAAGLKLNDLKTLNNLLASFTENFRTNMEPYELKRVADLATNISEKSIYSFSLDPDGKLICDGFIDLATGKPPIPIVVPPTTTPTPTPTPTPSTTVPKPGTTSSTSTKNSTSSTTTVPKKTTTTLPPTTPPPAPLPELVNPPTTAWVVMPCVNKTLTDIHQYLKQATELAKLRKETAVVEVQNSTGKSGLAAAKFQHLTDMGIDARFIGFTGKVPYDQTILYDNSHGSKPNTLQFLKDNYQFITSDINYTASTADFVIILGKDAL